jgi:UDP-glucuronate 4-epimerase
MKNSVEFIGMQPGNVKRTFADIEHSKQKLNYTSTTKIIEGIPKFIDWFKKHTI